MTSTPPPPVFMTIAMSSRFASSIAQCRSPPPPAIAAATANCENRAARRAAFGSIHFGRVPVLHLRGDLALLIARVEQGDPAHTRHSGRKVRPEVSHGVADRRDAAEACDNRPRHDAAQSSSERKGISTIRHESPSRMNDHSTSLSPSRVICTTVAVARSSPSNFTSLIVLNPVGTG